MQTHNQNGHANQTGALPAGMLSFSTLPAAQDFVATFDSANRQRALAAWDEISRLTRSLEDSNRELRTTLAEREKMQVVLVSALQSLSVGVLAVGQDGIVIVANPAACRIFQCELEALAARSIDSVLPEAAESDELLLTLQGAGGGQRRVQWELCTPGCEPRTIELTAIRSLPPYDRQLAGVILLEDVTQLRRLEQQAALKSRLTGMGEIAMNLAHEIRNPLGSISLFATALEHELAGNENLEMLAAQIVGGVKALEHIVANTLEFAKPRRLLLGRLNLTELLRETLTYLEHPLREKGIHVEFDHELAPAAEIAGDAEQLRQVLLNLMINAVQAMQQDGRLHLTVQRGELGGWDLLVSDDGIGIPEELLGKIFDPFFTTREKGSGIGLSIVHSILEAHGARIDVQSRVCAGSTFRISFPATAPFAQVA